MIVPYNNSFSISKKPWSISLAHDVSTDVSMNYPPFIGDYKAVVARGLQGLGNLGDATSSPVLSSVSIFPTDDRFYNVYGNNFNANSVVFVDGIPQNTTYLAPSQITAYLNPNQARGPSNFQVQNQIPGGTWIGSNVISFTTVTPTLAPPSTAQIPAYITPATQYADAQFINSGGAAAANTSIVSTLSNPQGTTTQQTTSVQSTQATGNQPALLGGPVSGTATTSSSSGIDLSFLTNTSFFGLPNWMLIGGGIAALMIFK